jgi:hypothetical protein
MTVNVADIVKIENLVNNKLYFSYKKKENWSSNDAPVNTFIIQNTSITTPVKITRLTTDGGMVMGIRDSNNQLVSAIGTIIPPKSSVTVEAVVLIGYAQSLSATTNKVLQIDVEAVERTVTSWKIYGECVPSKTETQCPTSNRLIRYENYATGRFSIEGGWTPGSRDVVVYCDQHTGGYQCLPDQILVGSTPPPNANVIIYNDGTQEIKIAKKSSLSAPTINQYDISRTKQYATWYNGEDDTEQYETTPPSGWVQCPPGGAYYKYGSSKATMCLSRYKVDPSHEWALKRVKLGTVDNQEYISVVKSVYELPTLENSYKEGTYTYIYGYTLTTTVSPTYAYVPLVPVPVNPQPKAPEVTTVVTRSPVEGDVFLRKVFAYGPVPPIDLVSPTPTPTDLGGTGTGGGISGGGGDVSSGGSGTGGSGTPSDTVNAI